MKVTASVMALLLVSGFAPQASFKLEVGAKLDRKYVPKKLTKQIMTHPGQMRPFIERSVEGVKYVIAFDSESREIKYINTRDPNFRTSDGLRVGSEMPVKRQQLDVYPGWEIRAPVTSDGWYPVVGTDLSIGFDLLGSFKESETKFVRIDSFSKGDN
jgi:hypothetical protein